MTLFTAEGMLRAAAAGTAGDADAMIESIRAAYVRWHDTQISVPAKPGDGWLVTLKQLRHRRAPGWTCLSAMHAGGTGTPDTPLNNSKGCGGVMRVAPLAFAGGDSFDLAVRAAAITHGHPSGYLSAGAFTLMVEQLYRGATPADAAAAALDALRQWPEPSAAEETLAAVEAAIALADEGAPSAEAVERLGEGWVGEEALGIAVYCVLAERGVRAALLLAVNHSGDSDSTGALAGDLLGAMHGVDALPPDLLDGVELREEITVLATDLAEVFVGGAPANAERYSPAPAGSKSSDTEFMQ